MNVDIRSKNDKSYLKTGEKPGPSYPSTYPFDPWTEQRAMPCPLCGMMWRSQYDDVMKVGKAAPDGGRSPNLPFLTPSPTNTWT